MWKDSETELDFLDYDYLIQTVQNIIMDDTLLPASIGVYGDWGSGKSSLMYMCKERLTKADKNIKCLVFNGWLFENYEDAKTAILGTILDEISTKKRLSKKAKNIIDGLYKSIDKFKVVKGAVKYGTDFLLTGGMGALFNIAANQILEKVQDNVEESDLEEIRSNISDELNNKELREDIRKFQKEFAALLEESKISRLVVFIDELDRCRPDTILDTLEAIKLFLFEGKVAFVIGADERHISYAVKSKFKDIEGIQIDIGKEYLEKLIQYPIRIPQLNADEVEIYIACLLLQSELNKDDFDKVLFWINDKKQDDFESFKPVLKKQFDLQEKIATAINPDEKPYQVLVNRFDKDYRLEEIDAILAKIKDAVCEILNAVREEQSKIDDSILECEADHDTVLRIVKKAQEILGLDKDKSTLFEIHHPVCVCTGPRDSRPSTNCDELIHAILAVVHETGHGLYNYNANDEVAESGILGEPVPISAEGSAKIQRDFSGYIPCGTQ